MLVYFLGLWLLFGLVVPAQGMYWIYAHISPHKLDKSLLDACAQGDVKKAKKLIKAGASVKAQSDVHCSTLWLATLSGSTYLVELLLEAGAQVDNGDKFCYTPLMAAALNDFTDIAKLLIKRGAAINRQNYYDEKTALMLAAHNNSLEAMSLLITHGALLNMQDYNGWTALIEAAHYGLVQALQALINAGAQLDVQDAMGNTALMHALVQPKRYSEIITLLSDAGASLLVSNKFGNTVLTGAVLWNNKEAVALLLKYGAHKHDKLMSTCNAQGYTPLLLATYKNHIHIARMLIASGANIHGSTSKKKTALRVAVCRGYRTIARTLIAAGADIPKEVQHIAKYAQPSRELMAQVQTLKDHPEALGKLVALLKRYVSKHTFVDLVDAQGNTLMHYAVLAHNRVLIALLLYYMAQSCRAESLITCNNNGYTPLDLAVVISPLGLLPIFFKLCHL